MNSTIDKLLDLNFSHIGDWILENDLLDYVISIKNAFKINNCLYAIVVRNEEGTEIKYIGKTTQTLEKRFYQYKRGNGISTNNRIHNNIIKELNNSNKVEIWALIDDIPLNWGSYDINLAAGLEDSFIDNEKPVWNGGRTETSIIEVDTLTENEESSALNTFTVKIGETYYKYGYINPGIKASSLLGEHNEDIIIVIGEDKSVSIKGKINRTANQNGSVRIGAITELSKYYQENYEIGDIAILEIIDKNKIKIY